MYTYVQYYLQYIYICVLCISWLCSPMMVPPAMLSHYTVLHFQSYVGNTNKNAPKLQVTTWSYIYSFYLKETQKSWSEPPEPMRTRSMSSCAHEFMGP